MLILRYGITNTYLIKTNDGYLLIDTDFPNALNAFYKTIKAYNIKVEEIKYLLSTHYHPDHCGLVGNLINNGAKLIILDNQIEHVHYAEHIYEKDKMSHVKIDKSKALLIKESESRNFFQLIGINGEIITSSSHSLDGIVVIFDDGNAIVGDLDPYQFIDIYDDNTMLKDDWNKILKKNPKTIHFAHRPLINID